MEYERGTTSIKYHLHPDEEMIKEVRHGVMSKLSPFILSVYLYIPFRVGRNQLICSQKTTPRFSSWKFGLVFEREGK